MKVRVTAGDETRTRDIDLGRVALYQLSYSRSDARFGRLALYQLSYSRSPGKDNSGPINR
jgi:hypothetical protein